MWHMTVAIAGCESVSERIAMTDRYSSVDNTVGNTRSIAAKTASRSLGMFGSSRATALSTHLSSSRCRPALLARQTRHCIKQLGCRSESGEEARHCDNVRGSDVTGRDHGVQSEDLLPGQVVSCTVHVKALPQERSGVAAVAAPGGC